MTFKDFLNKQDPSIQAKIIVNIIEQKGAETLESLLGNKELNFNVFASSFSWSDSREGEDYWRGHFYGRETTHVFVLEVKQRYLSGTVTFDVQLFSDVDDAIDWVRTQEPFPAHLAIEKLGHEHYYGYEISDDGMCVEVRITKKKIG